MFHRIRLELARCRDFPEGSPERGYELSLPLTADGSLDVAAWHRHHDPVAFDRFWGAASRHGVLRHDRHDWQLAFDDDSEAEEETLFRPECHSFKAGEYLSIKEFDGVTRTFVVSLVQ